MKKIKKFQFIFLYFCICLCACTNKTLTKEEQYAEKRLYVLNLSSKRIHSTDCGTGKSIVDKNKANIETTLNDLIEKGYIICGNCNAGIKEKGSSFSLIFGNLIESENNNYDFEYPIKEEYIFALEEMRDWYLNHIATYQKELSEEPLFDYDGNDKYIKEYEIEDKKYKVISTDSLAKPIDSYDGSVKILKANENAVLYYINNLEIIKELKIYLYPCELIANSRGDYNMAGDDCVRYLFSSLNYANRNFVDRITTIYGRSWRKINAKKMTNDKGLADAMLSVGFDIYDSKKIKTYNGYELNIIDENFKLEKGDIIARKGHIHIYLGNGEEKADNFGWGRVQRTYPEKYNFKIVKNEIGNYVVKLEKMNGDSEKYTRVYRYKGKDLNQ